MTATDSKYQRTSLIIGLSIPLCMMLFVAGAIYLPRWFKTVEPAIIDFVYSTGQRDAYTHYWVKDNHLIREQRPTPESYTATSEDLHFFLHEVASNRSRELSFIEASELFLNPSNLAPDGYRIEYGRRAGWFPFDNHSDYSKQFLVKNHRSQSLDLTTNNSGYYYNSYRFHGWVTTQ